MSSTHIVVDLGFGDAGKGTMVDALARRSSTPPLVVRYNGGAQAGHNVHTDDGRHHTFSQFGAGTFVPGSRTLLSEHMIFHPTGLMAENEHLVSVGVQDAIRRLLVDGRALVVTPYQQSANRLREIARGDGRHGTCGLGIGETVGDSNDRPDMAVRASDLLDVATLRRKMVMTREWKRHQIAPLLATLVKYDEATPDIAVIEDTALIEKAVQTYARIGDLLRIVDPVVVDFQIRESEHVVFEGAQGVLLDEWYGFHPHTTWSTTTTKNADALIARAGRAGPVSRMGVVRAYATRHGQGPFPTEDATLSSLLPDRHNLDTSLQGRFRVGWFDVPLARYALSLCPGITELAVTCIDRCGVSPWKFCEAYEVPEESRERFYQLEPGGVSVGLRVHPPGDLVYQERLAKDLLLAKPVYREPDRPEGIVETIEKSLDVPVLVRSMGPTANEKVWL